MSLNIASEVPAAAWGQYESTTDRRSMDGARSHEEVKAMAHTVDAHRRSLSKFKRAESLEFRLIFVAAFVVFLVAAIVERLLPITWLRRERPKKSIIQQAKDAANTCAAYAFMG
jgi:hypothetical protein